jgi:phage shock protein A
MTLITRFSRLFRADLHAVLDRIEEPDLVLRQSVREMEEDLTHDRRRVALLREEQRQLAAREKDLEQSLATLGEELDTCFAAGKDDLARLLLRRQLEAERLGGLINRKREDAENAVRRLEAVVHEKDAQLEAMRQKAELFTPDAPPFAAERWDIPSVSVRDEEVEVAFLREQQRRAGR